MKQDINGRSFKSCEDVVNAAISLVMTNEHKEIKECLGKYSYIKEFRTIILNLPRQVGKSTYIQNNAGPNDLVIFHNRNMAKKINNVSTCVFSNIKDLGDLIFDKEYETIWCDELPLVTLSGNGFKELLKRLIKTGDEIVIALTTL
jgi:hypothetical protein